MGLRDTATVLKIMSDDIAPYKIPKARRNETWTIKRLELAAPQEGPFEWFTGEEYPLSMHWIEKWQSYPNMLGLCTEGRNSRRFKRWEGDLPRGMYTSGMPTPWYIPTRQKDEGWPTTEPRTLYVSPKGGSTYRCWSAINTTCWSCWGTDCWTCRRMFEMGAPSWGEGVCPDCPDWFESEWTLRGRNARYSLSLIHI